MGNRHAHLIRVVLIACVTLVAYSNTFHSAFHFDDYSSIITHPYIKSIHNIPYFFYYNGAPLTNRPVTMASFAISFGIGGLNPLSYHWMNFLIHAANSILVYILLFLMLKGRVEEHMNISFFASLMFAAHPIQTQAVTYVVQRFEILAAFFYLLSLVLFIKGRLGSQDSQVRSMDSGQTSKRLNLKSFLWYSASLIASVLAMGSKETAVTLPVIILLYDFFFISDGSFKALFKKWHLHFLFFLTLLPLLYFMRISQFLNFVSTNIIQSAPTSSIDAGTTAISRYEYLFTQFRVIWTYIKLLIAPINQNLDYNYHISKSLVDPITTLLGGAGIILLLAFGIYLFRKQRHLSFFIFWFFIILAPTSSIAIFPDVIFEHRVYLSSLGYFLMFAVTVFKAVDIMFDRDKKR